MMLRTACAVSLLGCALQAQQPDVAAQRVAMKKLEFLVGRWSGNATIVRGAGEALKIVQSEEVQYKLDGLVMLIEGTGRDADGKPVFRALATVAYDDVTSTYRFRAYNEGRFLDTELTVKPNGFVWGYAGGPLKVTNTMAVNGKGEWIETTESTYGSTPPRKVVEMRLERQQ